MVRRCAVVALIAVSIGAVGRAQESAAVRRFQASGRPLAEQVRASEGHVLAVIGPDKPLMVSPPEGVSSERFWADASDFVLALEVISVRPRAVYRAAVDIHAVERTTRNVPASLEEANWIESTIRVRVKSALKSPSPLTEGDELLFEEDGGTVIIRGVQVEAVSSWRRALVQGKRYLVFGTLSRTGRLNRTAVFEEPFLGGLLVNLHDDDRMHRLETLGFDQAVAYVESEMSK